jgi:hypothetical protein
MWPTGSECLSSDKREVKVLRVVETSQYLALDVATVLAARVAAPALTIGLRRSFVRFKRRDNDSVEEA